MGKNLIIWNGMGAKQNSGGDLYTAKFINFSKLNYDLVLPENSRELILDKSQRNLLITDKYRVSNLFSLIILYLFRIIRSILLINQKKYSVAIASSPFLFDVVPLIFSKSDKKIVILFHIVPERKAVNFSGWVRFNIAKIEKRISYFLIKWGCEQIITGNEIVKKDLERIFPDKKIVVGDAGIYIEKLKCKKMVKDPDLACFIGRLTSQKGVFDLVKIMEKITKKNPKFKLILIGKGPDERELILKIKEAKLRNHILLKGFVSDKEKNEILSKSKFFFFPSYEEGWGIALAESLYQETVSICYELPYYKNIFKDYPIYVPLGDTEQFVYKFFEKYKSKPKKEQRKFIEKYEDEKVIKEVLRKLTIVDKV